MRIIPKRFTRSTAEAPAPISPSECSHAVLTPTWASPTAMWHKEAACGFACPDCHRTFTPAEQQAREQDKRERLQMTG